VNTFLEILALYKRDKFIKNINLKDVFILGKYNKPNIANISSPPYSKDIKLIEAGDLFSEILKNDTSKVWAKYNDLSSFANNTEKNINDGVYVNPMTSFQKTINGFDPYSTKFNFTVLNAVYVLTISFKATAPNANQTHMDIDFFSGNNEYEKLNKSVIFYKGNDQVENFHEVFQFYVDQSLISNGLEIKIKPHGGSIKLGDATFFIQRTQ
jgi:hypothetical protein